MEQVKHSNTIENKTCKTFFKTVLVVHTPISL